MPVSKKTKSVSTQDEQTFCVFPVLTAESPFAQIAPPLLSWYGENARTLPWRSDPAPYRVWISEIMLQQTRVEAVLSYFMRFLAVLPDIPALAAASPELLLKLWEGLGYYSRARNLQKAAQIVCERYGGCLPASFEALRELPGFGDYTAGAVASIAFGLRVPAVDGNVLRVFARLLDAHGDVSLPQAKREAAVLALRAGPAQGMGAFNQALMDLGATVCLPNGAPQCSRCPLASLCLGLRAGTAPALPCKKAKKPRRVEERTVLAVVGGGRVLLQKRPESGLLAGLWELPNAPGFLSEQEALRLAASLGAKFPAALPLKASKHLFSHVEWHMRGFLIRAASFGALPDGAALANAPELREGYALPSAFRAYSRLLPGLLEGL